METLPALAVIAAGYLVGTISFARMILGRSGATAGVVRVPTEGSEDLELDTVSATAVGDQLGPWWGLATSLLDMLKTVAVMVGALLLLPEGDYHLLAGVASIVGHNYPVWFRFRGGRGESPLVGGLLVVDAIGFVIANTVGLIIGTAVGRVLAARWIGHVLIIPWMFVVRGAPEGFFALAMSFFYFLALNAELGQLRRVGAEGAMPPEQEIADAIGMGAFWRRVEPFSVPRLLARSKD